MKKKRIRYVSSGERELPAKIPNLALTLLTETPLIRKKTRRRKMKNKIKAIILAAIFLLGNFTFRTGLRAQIAAVPKVINFQSILTDPSGIPLADGFYDIIFRILNVNGEELYVETQHLETANGVVSAMIGSGGDLNLATLKPDIPRFLGVTVAGETTESLLEIASVPYAMYAAQALSVAPESIATGDILPGAITADLLAEGLLDGPANTIRTELATPSGAASVGADDFFNNSASTTVQTVLQDFDTAITNINTKLNGDLNMGGNKVTNVASPVTPNDVATKQYVDGVAANLAPAVDPNPAPTVRAAGVVNANPQTASLSSGYNVSRVALGRDVGEGGGIVVTFENSVSLPYYISVTRSDNINAVIAASPMDSDRFMVGASSQQSLGSFHFVVLK